MPCITSHPDLRCAVALDGNLKTDPNRIIRFGYALSFLQMKSCLFASEKCKTKKILLARYINIGSVSQLPSLQEQVAVPPAVSVVKGMRAVSWWVQVKG